MPPINALDAADFEQLFPPASASRAYMSNCPKTQSLCAELLRSPFSIELRIYIQWVYADCGRKFQLGITLSVHVSLREISRRWLICPLSFIWMILWCSSGHVRHHPSMCLASWCSHCGVLGRKSTWRVGRRHRICATISHRLLHVIHRRVPKGRLAWQLIWRMP